MFIDPLGRPGDFGFARDLLGLFNGGDGGPERIKTGGDPQAHIQQLGLEFLNGRLLLFHLWIGCFLGRLLALRRSRLGLGLVDGVQGGLEFHQIIFHRPDHRVLGLFLFLLFLLPRFCPLLCPLFLLIPCLAALGLGAGGLLLGRFLLGRLAVVLQAVADGIGIGLSLHRLETGALQPFHIPLFLAQKAEHAAKGDIVALEDF